MTDAQIAEVREILDHLQALKGQIDHRLRGTLEFGTSALESLLKLDGVYKEVPQFIYAGRTGR